MASGIGRGEGVSPHYQITTSEADRETMRRAGIDAIKLAQSLYDRISQLYGLVQRRSLVIGNSHGSEDVLRNTFAAITAIERGCKTCPICHTDVKVNYTFKFILHGGFLRTGYSTFIVIDKSKEISMSPLEAHRIIRHHDFGEGEGHIDPVKLSEFLQVRGISPSELVDILKKILDKC